MFNVYETRVLFKAMIVPVVVLGSSGGLRAEVPGNRVRHVETGPGWGVSATEPTVAVVPHVEEADELQSEFVWNDAIYEARKAAKEFGS